MMAVVSEADGFAIAMMVMLTLALGSVLMILIRIARHASKQSDDLDDLMEGSDKEPVPPSGKQKKPEREAWEKEADWWKK
ncbi:hypothetical protein [Haloferula rosea]|uniref:Uncharacterized protein n=1 Tax=Haloferula rosea TaxID=490093 RepID=A0A934VFM2_9BACT|nr:hypothetical protein [Haloferula rosea]MBK1826730.1 hypothetical protein [Haloferula rosea]